MTKLDQKKCTPCEGGIEPLRGSLLNDLVEQLNHTWVVVDEHHLHREFAFDDFQSALDFTNDVGEIAEEEGHHPNIFLTWGEVKIDIWTHKIDGLSTNDFILAAKINRLL